MIATKIIVNGKEIDLSLRPRPWRWGGYPEPRLEALNLNQTVATINLETPIRAKSTATIEIEWNTKLPGGQKIEKITLDPYGRFPDKNLADNIWPR